MKRQVNMTTPTSSTSASNSPKQSGVAGCFLTMLIIVFAILGIYDLVFGSVLAYVFSSARMFAPASIAIVVIIACDCFIYFFIAFRLKRQHWLVSAALLAVVWLILPLPLRSLINTSTMRLRQDGYSMGNTLPNGSYILANRQAYQLANPQRGDIVIIQFPSSSNSVLIVKRVIGLPGETVSINQGQVSINGAPINEQYVFAEATYTGEWNIPEGEYFVLGDNRPDSSDSHAWGFVPRDHIMAKVVWIYFPLSNFGKIVDPNFAP